ncbi:hypothetical protein KAH55_03920 [bacterium]|nr:hypothetical protein [bacterium]
MGNPGAVEFRLNNQLLPFAGNPNQVTTLLITENGMSIQ